MVPGASARRRARSAYACSMDETSSDLMDALLRAFPAFVADRAAAFGLDDESATRAAAVGHAELEQSLGALFRTAVADQAGTPLGAVRAALAPLTAALEEAGVARPRRDASQQEIAPDDPYDLGPASASELGATAAAAALAWGVSKAKHLDRPMLVLVGGNLMDCGPIEAAAAAAGYRFEMVAADGVDECAATAAFVDLEAECADGAIRTLSGRGVRVIAYGPHVDDLAMVRARSLGASVAEPRSRVLRDPGAYLSPVV